MSAHHPHPLRRSEAPAAGTGVGEGRPATVPTSPRRAPWTRPSDRLVTALALGAWALVIVVARMWGDAINRSGRVIRLHAPPLVGWDDLDLTGLVVLPLAAGVVAVAVLPRWAARLPWRRLLVVAAGAAALWGLALALTAGWEGVTRPLILKNDEYLLNVADVGSPGPFLDHFTEDIDRYVNHVRSHPPGMLLALWTFDWVGLGGTGWAAVLCVGGGVAAVPAVLLATRDLAGERAARRAAPFVAVAPAALWVVTTADALFAGVGAWASTAVILALGRRGRRADALAVLGGLGFGVLLMLHYALFLVAAVPAAVALHRRRLRPLILAALAAAVVLGAFALAGFWWVDGFFTAREEYRESVARTRPLGYFMVANLAAFGIALGPAVAVALARLRDRAVWLVVGGALAAVAAANVSGFSKGEVERIWQPFSVWVLLAGTALWGARGGPEPASHGDEARARRWLALQVAFAIVVEVSIRTRW